MKNPFTFSVTRVVFALLIASFACCAQNVSFGLSSGSGSPGSTVVLGISMDTPSGISPAAIEWTVNYPAVDFSSVAVTPGPDASGKSVSCDSITGSTRCVLWGDNSTSMGNGVAATVSMVISGSTRDTSSQVQISSPMASSPDAYPFASTATGGTVTIVQPAALDGFNCLPVSIAPPAVSTCTVQLTAAAPTNGVSVGLTTSQPDVTIPATVSVAAGLTSANFTATPLSVASPTAINLTASYAGVNEGFGLTVDPVTATLTGMSVSPSLIVNGQTAAGTVTISMPAGPGGIAVALSSSNTAGATVPAWVTIPQGASTAPFTVTPVTVNTGITLVVTAAYAGVNMPANLSVYPPVIPTNVVLYPNSIASGKTSTGTVTVSEAAGVSGAVISLGSSNTAVATVPATVTIPHGQTTAQFTVTGLNVTRTSSASITATHAGAHMSATLTVR